jgi:hypothetical protein
LISELLLELDFVGVVGCDNVFKDIERVLFIVLIVFNILSGVDK